jgi:L-threonylcarbamoyladenylate synthase
VNDGGLAEILPTHTPTLFAVAVRRAAELLRAGELVALPTETVYGLAANAWDARAVAKIFAAKERPARNPIIVHVAGMEMARSCVTAWPESARLLADAFWPGPLTLVLPRSRLVPDVVTAGGHTVGVRWPSHPFMQAVLRECGFPLAAPSANPANGISPTQAEHVREGLGRRISLIVDGGASQVGIESTVLDLNVRPPAILRPGMVHSESLRAVLGEFDAPALGGSVSGEVLRSPGQLVRHYAPRARLLVLRWADEADLRRQLQGFGVAPVVCWVLAYQQIPAAGEWGGVCVIPHDPEAYARALYAEWHRCDAEGAECIVVEAVPEGPAWQGLADRLRRAAAKADPV